MKPNREDRPQNISELLSEIGDNEKTIIDYRNQKDRTSPEKEWELYKDTSTKKENVEQVQYGNSVSTSKWIGYMIVSSAVLLSLVCIYEHGSRNFSINEGKELFGWGLAIILFIVGSYLIKK